MKLNADGKFRRAVHTALAAGVAAGGGFAPAVVFAQTTTTTTTTTTTDATKLETIEVTGSRIRRVDTETASPLVTIDRQTIEASGVRTLGDLVQELPSISGAATNPQVNNGGGDGRSEVSLRGLGEDRTLVLLNGRRIVNIDINAIPINLIERVEILKEGASAIYGSDAIAGVVNFITRKDYSGAELSVQHGKTFHNDGENNTASLMWGSTSTKSNIVLGLNYNKQNEISAGNRDFSSVARYLYNNAIREGGSSRVPTGRIFTVGGMLNGHDYGCGSVTRNQGASGTSLDDYHCFVTGPDSFNFQPFNLILTPQERGSIFTLGNFDVNEHFGMYAEMYHNFTESGFTIAPLPFDSRADQVVISADNIYNPFNQSFGGGLQADGTQFPNFTVRMLGLGGRSSNDSTQTTQVTAGARGSIVGTWTYDASFTYGRAQEERGIEGYLLKSAIGAAFGPSFIAPDGTPTCGTPTAPIPSCTPVNPFSVNTPEQAAALSTIAAGYNQTDIATSKIIEASATGDLFTLPAGAMKLAAGYMYREDRDKFDVDPLSTGTAASFFTSCGLAQETCSGDSGGVIASHEVFGELFIPILADVPGANALNVDLGVRHSHYQHFDIPSITRFTGKIEYRPVADALIRATYAQVYRAPTINDETTAPTSNAPVFNDPCTNLTSAQLADPSQHYAETCEHVAPDTNFAEDQQQVTGIVQGAAFSGVALRPEKGTVWTGGFVYDASFLKGLSMEADFWKYKIHDLILGNLGLDPAVAAAQCLQTGNPVYCGLIHRFPDGKINFIEAPITNLGGFETTGVDLGVKYATGQTPVGRFRFSVDATRTFKFDFTPDESSPAIQHAAGTFDRQFGHFAQWRALGGIQWENWGLSVLYTARYIGKVRIEDPDGCGSEPQPADAGFCLDPGIGQDVRIGSVTYHNISVGYDIPVIDTELMVGVDNIFDKVPPLFYFNNVLNANTDVSTYDTQGSRYFMRLTKKF
jgi:iron complex outermembrane receptor protein